MELQKAERFINKPTGEMASSEMWSFFFEYLTNKSKREKMKGIIPQGKPCTSRREPTVQQRLSAARPRGIEPFDDCARSVMPEQARSRLSLRLSNK